MTKTMREEFEKKCRRIDRKDGSVGFVTILSGYDLDYIWDWHISQLQSVFEEIEKTHGKQKTYKDTPLENKLLLSVYDKGWNDALDTVLSFRQKYLSVKEKKKNGTKKSE